MLRFSQPSCRQNISLCNKNVSTKLYGGTKPIKFESLKIFENPKIFGPLFWGYGPILGSDPIFITLLWLGV
jgi:hypothetical protein